MPRSILSDVARAAGLAGTVRRQPATSKPRNRADQRAGERGKATSSSRENSAVDVKRGKRLVETLQARDYAAVLKSHGHQFDQRDREIILQCGMAWQSSEEVRREFRTFPAFAAYTMSKQRPRRVTRGI